MHEEKTKKQTHQDIWFGEEGFQRLVRLATREVRSYGDIVRDALVAYELNGSLFQDAVRDAVLDLFNTQLPDEANDHVDDPRQAQAVLTLAQLLHSIYAAQGIAQALTLLQTHESGRPLYIVEEQDLSEDGQDEVQQGEEKR